MLKFSFSLCALIFLFYSTHALLLLAPQDITSTMPDFYNYTTVEENIYDILSSSWNIQPPPGFQSFDPTDEITLLNDTHIPYRNEYQRRHGSKVKDNQRKGHHIKEHLSSQESLENQRKGFRNDKQSDLESSEGVLRNQKTSNTGIILDTKVPIPNLYSKDLTHEKTSSPHTRRKREIRARVIPRNNSALGNARRRFWALRLRRRPSSRRYPRVMARIARPVIVTRTREPTPRRTRRIEAKVGVLVVVDNSIYRQYFEANGRDPKLAVAKIRRYYGMVYAMMDQRFQTIKHPLLSVTVKISGILIAETREDSLWMEKLADWKRESVHGRASINTDKALERFSKWVSSRRDLPEYDHAMLFTAYRLSNQQDTGLGGMAYLNAICDTKSGNSASIVGDKGDFQSVKVATHELAHSLGAKHDGDPGCEACPSTDNYVMSSLTVNRLHILKNAFYFSPCSIRDMISHLNKDKASCVRNEPRVYYTYDIKRLPPGRIYNAHVQCKLIFGNKSELCWEGNLMNMMCGQLWCRDPNLSNGCRTNSYLTALPGTQCGAHKVCHLGECVSDTFGVRQAPDERSRSNIIPKIPRPSPRIRGSRRSRRHRNIYTRVRVRPSTRTRTRPETETRTRTRTRPQNRTRTNTRPDTRTRSRPEIRTRSRPEIRTRSRPEIRTRSRPQNRTRSRPEIRTRSRPENRTRSRPEIRTRSRPENRTRSRPENRTRSRPEIRTRSRPEIRTRSRPENRTRSENRTRTRPDTRTRTRPDTRTRTRSENRTRTRSENRTRTRPETRTRTRPETRTKTRTNTRRHDNPSYDRRRQRYWSRRRSRCRADKNSRYCRRLIQLNPSVCKRKAVRQYCCYTCRRR